MINQEMAVKEDYLRPTNFCDSDHPAITTKAKGLTQATRSEKEAALEIFHFVRDGILFGADRYITKASETLQRRLGFCIPKTNLQIALLRAAGIPARYHRASVKKDGLKGIVADFAYNIMPEVVWEHTWCECYLAGSWLACESLFDKALYVKAIENSLLTKDQIPTIDWDGESDLVVMKSWITEDHGNLATFDGAIRKASTEQGLELIGRIGRHFSNQHTNKLRTSN